MIQSSNFYYPQEEIPYNVQEQIYSIRNAMDEFLGKLLFSIDENPTDRVVWAPQEYAVYRRREQLGELKDSSGMDDLQLPYVTYFRDDSWTVDDRPAGNQLSSVMNSIRWGPDNTGVQAQVRQAQRTFKCVALFASERDATIAQDTIFWLYDRVHWVSYSIYAGQTKILIPLSIELTHGPDILPDDSMFEWMKERKMVLVYFNFLVRTPLLKIEPDPGEIHFTEEVVFYFNNREFDVPADKLPDTWEEWKDISEKLTALIDADEAPEPSIEHADTRIHSIEYNVDPENANIKFTWEYMSDTPPDSITFYLHRGSKLETHELDLTGYESTEEAPTSFVMKENEPDSIYDVAMLIHSSSPPGSVWKYHYQISTPSLPDRGKGLGGLKGMTL